MATRIVQTPEQQQREDAFMARLALLDTSQVGEFLAFTLTRLPAATGLELAGTK